MEDQPEEQPQAAVALADCIVEHGSDFNRTPHNVSHRDFLQFGRVRNGLGVLPEDAPIGDPLFAYVDLGRWIVRCDICNSAVVAESEYPWFTCTACGSAGKWRPVVFPENKVEIETALLRRPGWRNANTNRFWLGDESVAMLYLENAQHGIEGERESEAMTDFLDWLLDWVETDPREDE